MKKIFLNCNLILPDRILEDGALCAENGRIEWIGRREEASGSAGCEEVNCGGEYLSPGFIDVHVHGGGGGSFLSYDLEEHVTAMKMHLSHGVTSIMPTPVVNTAGEMQKLAEIKETIDGMEDMPNHLGYFLEGPYTIPHPNMSAEGAEPIVIKPELYEPIVRAGKGTIKRWMAAPELEGALEFGSYIRKNGIIPCMGHSNATYAEAAEALNYGYSTVTHLYSVMSTVTRESGFRRGGLVESGLLMDDLDVELICDGCHLPPELINLAIKAKGYDRLMLVSDATHLAGKPEGEYEMMGHKVIIEDGVCKLPDRSAFLGSIASGDVLVRTVYKKAGQPLWAAVRMAAKTPARHCGLSGRKGEIAVGADADLVVFNDDVDIQKVFVAGKEMRDL